MFPQSSEEKGTRSGSLMRSTVHCDRDRSRMRPWNDRLRAGRWGPDYGITIGSGTPAERLLLPPSPERHRRRASFLLFLFQRFCVPPARENTHIMRAHILSASHDIPLVRVSNGTAHNLPRVSGWRYGYPDIKVVPRWSTCDLGKDRDFSDRPKKETEHSQDFR